MDTPSPVLHVPPACDARRPRCSPCAGAGRGTLGTGTSPRGQQVREGKPGQLLLRARQLHG